MNTKHFPNGFSSWQETHFEIVRAITELLINDSIDEKNPIYFIFNIQGTGGLYEIAEDWTDEFEKINEGRDWDGEFFDDIETFINLKINKHED